MSEWYKTAKENEEAEIITPAEFKKMEEWFNKRTKKHISLVEKYCKKINDFDEDRFGEIMEIVKTHDQSKFEEPEYTPYIYITWKYKCEADGKDFEIPEDMLDKTIEATEHHISDPRNKHHPEAHNKKKTGLINKNDRDAKPEEMVDGTKMKNINIVEMVADWCAVSSERGSNPKDWADSNVNIRWKFNDDQKDLIYEIIDAIWE